MSTTGSIEYHQTYSESDNSEFMSAYDTDETIEKLKFLVQKYQVDLENQWMFDGVDGLNWKCCKISPNDGGS